MADRRAWIEVSNRRCAWIGVSDQRCAWIEVLDGNFKSAFEFQMEISAWIRVSDRCRAPYLDLNFREFGIERSFREDSRTESCEWRKSLVSGERGFDIK